MADDPPIRNAGRLERVLGDPRFQRPFAAAASLLAFVLCAWIAWTLLGTQLGDPDSVHGGMRRVELGMRLLLIAVAASLAGYLSLAVQRKALARLLAISCGALAAGLAIFMAAWLYLRGVGDVRAVRLADSQPWMFVGLLVSSVGLMSVWLFGTMKFLLYFPKPVKLMDLDPLAADTRGRIQLKWEFEWRWFATPQFAALVVGWVLIVLLGWQGARLASSTWEGAVLYMICWAPFAFVSAKQRHVDEHDRRAIRWVVLGQSVWMVVFLLALVTVLVLRASGALVLADWTASERFLNSLLLALFEGFIVVFLVTLAISILYHGTIDPDLMIRRTWALGAIGLLSGILLVVVERALASAVAGWAGLSSLDALTLVAIVTAVLMVPLRARVERLVRRVLEGWQSAFAIADGRRQVACIVFADLSGYTALTERDERAAITLAAVFHRAADSVAQAQGGRLIKTIGDAVMLRLPTTDAAVAAVRDLTRGYTERAARLGLDPLPVHSAIHRGEVVEGTDGDVFGATVNLAARLLGAAGPHEVVASASALEGLSAGVAHEAMGEREFKNVEQPVACFRLAV